MVGILFTGEHDMSMIATHESPVLIREADFIIRADLSDHSMSGRFEQLWARRIEDSIFELCCIPFFTYGFALRDWLIVDNSFTVRRRFKRSGNRVLRIALVDNCFSDNLHVLLHEWIVNTGLLFEWFESRLLAVDLPHGVELRNAVIDDYERNGKLFTELLDD